MTAYNKILVVSLDNLGDSVMATSMFPVLRSFFPQAELGFWVKSYSADAFRDFPLIDHLHSADPFWDKSPGHGKGSMGAFLSTWKEVRKTKYDAALVLNAEWRRAGFCFLAGIPQRIGFHRRKSEYFLTETFRPMSPEPHVVEEHRGLLEFWLKTNISPSLTQPTMPVLPAVQRWAKEWRVREGLVNRPLIVLHPFTGRADRNWPLDYYFDFIETMRTQKPELGFVISCGSADEAALKAILSKRSHLKVSCLINRPLREMKAVLSQTRLFIGGDTGPSHLAAAMGTPVISIFGPSDPGRFRPRGSGLVRILHHTPLSDLKPDQVVRAAAEILVAH